MSSYLDKISYDHKLDTSVQGVWIRNFRIVILVIFAIIGIGYAAYSNIARRQNPEIKIPIVTVAVILPGAAPADVETLLTIPLEEKLTGVKGLDTITSTSVENASSIVMQFLSGTDVDKAKADVQSIVDSVSTLPEDAKRPIVAALDFEDSPVWQFVLSEQVESGESASLQTVARRLEKKLKELTVTDRVTTAGLDEEVVEITLKPESIAAYGLNALTVANQIKAQLKSYPAGQIETNGNIFSLAIDKQVETVDDIRSVVISIGGSPTPLGEIAQISLKSKTKQSQLTLLKDGKQARGIAFNVYRKTGTDIVSATKTMEEEVHAYLKTYGDKYQVTTTLNSGEEIADQFTELTGEFETTILLVAINLFIFLGLRQALIASLTVPLTFLSSIAIIHALGLTLNFLTLFAFLIALGLLIDDTIVIVSAMTRYYASGKFTPFQTGVLVWKDFIVPIWSTTIITIWAFVPLLLATGIIGEFIKPIPIVVAATMISSTAIAVLVTIPLMVVFFEGKMPKRVAMLLKIVVGIALVIGLFSLLPQTPLLVPSVVLALVIIYFLPRVFPSLKTQFASWFPKVASFWSKHEAGVKQKTSRIVERGLIDIEALSAQYSKLIGNIISSKRAKWTTLGLLIVFSLVAYMLIPFGLVKNEFFPKTNGELLYINGELPVGTAGAATKAELARLTSYVEPWIFAGCNKNKSDIRKNQECIVEYTTVTYGQSVNLDSGGSNSGENAFSFTIKLTPIKERKYESTEFATDLRAYLQKFSTSATVTVVELSGGPPAGSDLQIELSGNELTELNTYADSIIDFLKKQKGIVNPKKSVKPGTPKLVFTPDRARLAEQGITVDAIGFALRQAAVGTTVDTIKLAGSNDDTDIIIQSYGTAFAPDELSQLEISGQGSTKVPLSSLGTFALKDNPTAITRSEGKRTLSVSAGVESGYVIPDKNTDLENFAKSMKFGEGYAWKTGGVNEENQKSLNSIFAAMGLAALLILITLVIEFKSFRQAFMVLAVIPLAIPGVLYVFALTGTPISFPAVIGILALFGIVVTNAVVVVEKINSNIREGMNIHDAIVDASGSRLEPILLTSVTSILGLIPITISDPLWRGLGGAIISGLLFSGSVKLFFIPIVYSLVFGNEKEKNKRPEELMLI